MGIFASTADRVASWFGYTRRPSEEVVQYGVREGLYKVNQALYDGTIYQTRANGGALEDVLTTFIGPAFNDANRYKILPACMPFAPIVDAYQYVLPGVWGNGIEIADSTADGRDVNQRIIAPLGTLWRNSNLDTEKQKFIKWAANFGTIGMRVTTGTIRDGQPPRIAIGFDHPARLFNFEEDAEGNVTAVCLKYRKQVNFGTLADPDWQSVEIVEELTKDDFSYRQDDKEQLEDNERLNALGFCPYVIHRHKDNGTPYGDHAYKGIESAVHRINWRVTRQDKSIDRHQFPKWFATAGGDAPTTDVQMGEDDMTYVQTLPDTPPPTLDALVPKIDQANSQAFWIELRDALKHRQPELNLVDVKMLANVSGEALARILKPTEKAISDVRPGYHHALTRVMQMGVSAGVLAGAWDVGTGMGTAEAADRAFREGLESFTFKPMPLLPPTAYEAVQAAKANQAEAQAKLDLASRAKNLGLPRREQWRLAGYSESEIAAMEEEVAQQDIAETETGDVTANA